MSGVPVVLVLGVVVVVGTTVPGLVGLPLAVATPTCVASSRAHGTRVRAEQVLDEEVRRAAVRFVEVLRASATDLEDALGLVRAEWWQG